MAVLRVRGQPPRRAAGTQARIHAPRPFRCRIPYDGSGPGATPDLLVCLAGEYQEIDAEDVDTTARGFRYFDRDVARGSGAGVMRVQVDTVAGIVVVVLRIPDVGPFGGSTEAIELGFGQDDAKGAVEVLTRVLDPDSLHY